MRVGVVGTGFGARVVAPTYEAAGAAVVDVVSARDDDGVAQLCRRDDVDLISIHSPPFLHTRHVGWACAAGRAVLCDKPFGRSVAEATAMLESASAAGVLNLLNFEFRHEPARVQAKQLIADGVIGTPEHLQWSVQNAGSRVPLRPHGWLFDRSLGGGWVGAWGAHAVDTVRWLLGDVVDAGARCRVTIAERPDRDGVMHRCDAEDAFTAWMTTEGGASVAIDTSFAAAVNLATRMTIFGSAGTLEITNDRVIVVRRADGTKEEVELPRMTGDQHAGALGPWLHTVVDAVRDQQQITPSFADGLLCRRVLDALLSEGQTNG